jgi:CsoR family transcriptional regulator, copper-sensing transcriptional repressor
MISFVQYLEASMDDHTKAGVLRRLQSAEGHMRGIQRMVEEDKYCIDVIKQIGAVQAALSKVQEIILDEHLHTCVTTAIRGDDAERREAVIDEIMGVFSISNSSTK